MRTKHKTIYKKNSGFTLVELLVTVGVFAIVSGLTLANYPKFNSQTAITGVAQQIAISIREAQVYGIAVKNSSTTASVVMQNVYPAYGIFFGTPQVGTTYGNATGYSVFFDKVTMTGPAPYFRPLGDNYFTDITELVETTRINNGSTIVSICGVTYTTPLVCTPARAVNIVFRRPNPDAIINIVTAGTWPFTSPTLLDSSRVDITIRSKDQAETKVIQVFSSGQINVQ
jgi:prepilin-type N-terminal cleavage/methylation domain-containing protein